VNLLVKFPWSKRPWEKEDCVFVLEEYGAAGGPGWVAITEPSGECPTKDDCVEFFKPGCTYRVMAKYIGGDKAGQFAGMVWKHWEPHPLGKARPKEAEAKPARERAEVKPSQVATRVMGAYAKQLEEDLTPLVSILDLLDTIRQKFSVGGGEGGGGPAYPPLAFEGGAPWFLHPWIVREAAQSVTDVLDHAFDRVEKLTKGEKAPSEEEKEEEEVELPSIDEFKEPSEVEEKVEKGLEMPSEGEEIAKKEEGLVEEGAPPIRDERPPSLVEWKKKRGRKSGGKRE